MDENEKEAIKEAFARTKNDIFTLGNEIYAIQTDILDMKNAISAISESINSIKIELLESKSRDFISPDRPINSLNPTHYPTQEIKIPAYPAIPSNNPTVPVEIGGLKYPNFDISTGNRGVPTDKQTNQQTDILEDISSYLPSLKAPLTSVDKGSEMPLNEVKIRAIPIKETPDEIAPELPLKGPEKPLKQQIREAEDMLDSLDTLKKEIRLKFKQITNQEMLVFSTVYALEESFPEGVEYRQIAAKLKLSESSIRDYIQKLTSKGIPVDKVKLNNKKILLKISPKLKNLAPLETLIKLRDL
jgi:hypothetical protein